MNSPFTNPLATRINHLAGERLRAADLEDGLGVEAWMRRLHVVGLHDTWGIALGLDVVRETHAPGEVGIGPGLAYDVRGRSLLISARRVVTNPWSVYPAATASASFDLVMIADAELGRRPAERDDGLCLACAEIPSRDVPGLFWRPSDRVRLGIEVPLVRATQFEPSQPAPGDPPPRLRLDGSIRRYTQTEARPHVAAGMTPAEQPWHTWPVGRRSVLGLETVVDISAWGFTSRPTILASLAADTSEATWSPLLGRLVELRGLLMTHVELGPGPAHQQFQFRIIPPEGLLLDSTSMFNNPAASLGVFRLPLHVGWLGIEAASGCIPGAGEILGRTVRCCQEATTSVPVAGTAGGLP